jgi:hypothetical protein
MIKQILQGVSGTTAKVLMGKMTNFDADGIMVDCKLSGTAGTRDIFADYILNMTFRTQEGEDINSIKGVRLLDAMKFSDFVGGASSKLDENNAAGRFVAYLPLGNYMISGDDSLEVSLSMPAHATAVCDVELTATDVIKANEMINGYESIKGNGTEIYLKNVRSIYLCSAETGAYISVEDQERSYNVLDREVIAAGLALGRIEDADESFGQAYNDGTGLSQNVRIKVPNDAYILVQRGYFPVKRIDRKAEDIALKLESIQNKIRVEDPEKAKYLEAYGLM